MDFGELLHVAQKNEHKAKKDTRKCYTTSFSAPKKEQKADKSLSANIQKFLARKEEEEKRKEQQEKRKRDELLALRSQDGKAKKRVAAMLKRTKAANKSAIEDAVDDDNTAVTLSGPSQPDEDDYGYVSQEASAYYNKLMDKYNSAPAEEPLFSQKKKPVYKDLNSTKDRVRMALLREEEEEMMPHKRKRRSKMKKEDDPGDTTVDYHSSDMTDLGNGSASRFTEQQDSDPELDQDRPVSKPKPRKAAPPPINFQDLLKLAEKKQFEPVKIEPKKKPDDEEDHRPMTKKQKLEFMKEQEWRQRKEEAARLGRASSSQTQPSPRIPKVNNREDNVQTQRSSGMGRNQERSSGMERNQERSSGMERNQERSNGMERYQERSNGMERYQERTSGAGQQMRIPKINSAKREERQETGLKEERRSSSGIRKDDRFASSGVKREDSSSQKYLKQNGSHNRESSHSASSNMNGKDDRMIRSNASGRDDRVLKPDFTSKDDRAVKRIQRDDNVAQRMYRMDSESNSVQKFSNIREISKEGSKHLKNSSAMSNTNAPKHIPLKSSETKQDNNYSGREKKVSVSGYDRKLQEAIMAKMQECQRKKKMEETMSSKQVGKQILGREPASKFTKEVEKTSSSNKTIGKVSSKTDLSSQKRSNLTNQKSNSTSHNSHIPSQERNTNTKPNAVPSMKPQMPPANFKPKAVISPAPKQTANAEFRARAMAQASGRMRPPSGPDTQRSKPLPPPESRPKQSLPPAAAAAAKPRQLPSDVRPKQFPPPDVRPKQFPPPDVRRKQFPPPDVRRNPKLPIKRRITDSEDEYDPEMDDFIDDGPEEEEDYSQHIREIFGYDRRKYSRINDDDDEDECMESNFATILKEDFISTKTGMMEDLEDMRREKEMERRKKLSKKKTM